MNLGYEICIKNIKHVITMHFQMFLQAIFCKIFFSTIIANEFLVRCQMSAPSDIIYRYVFDIGGVITTERYFVWFTFENEINMDLI